MKKQKIKIFLKTKKAIIKKNKLQKKIMILYLKEKITLI